MKIIKLNKGEGGFSLIELIIVVAVLGVLVAVVIPIYGNIQTTARHTALEKVSANSATQIAAHIAINGPDDEMFDSLDTQEYSYTDGSNKVGDLGALMGIPPDGRPEGTVNSSTDNVFVVVIKNSDPTDFAWAGTAIGSGHVWGWSSPY